MLPNTTLEYFIQCITAETRILQNILDKRIHRYRNLQLVIPIQAALRKAARSARDAQDVFNTIRNNNNNLPKSTNIGFTPLPLMERGDI